MEETIILGRSSLIGKKVFIRDSGTVKQYLISAINSRKTQSGEALSVSLTDLDGYTAVRDIDLQRLDPVPVATPEESPYKGVGTISATQDEATEWFVFLMLQAGALFQAMPTDARDEVERLMKARGCPNLDIKPALAYYDTAFKMYEDGK